MRWSMLLWLSMPAFAQDAPETPEETEASETTDAADAEVEELPALDQGNRLELDAQLVRGSTASGAVVLLHRRPVALPPLVQHRSSFRERTVLAALGTVPIVTPDPEEAP
jgi:hypothetical protein